MLFKLSNLNSNLALTLGYLNPALNNSVLDNMIKVRQRYTEPKEKSRKQTNKEKEKKTTVAATAKTEYKQTIIIIFKTVVIIRQLGIHLIIKMEQCYLIDCSLFVAEPTHSKQQFGVYVWWVSIWKNQHNIKTVSVVTRIFGRLVGQLNVIYIKSISMKVSDIIIYIVKIM